MNLGFPHVNLTTHHSEATLSFDVWGPLDFDVTTVFDRVEDPKPDSFGDLPEKNDFRLVVGLSVDL